MAALATLALDCPECDYKFAVALELTALVSEERYNAGTVTVEIKTTLINPERHEHGVEVERNV